MCHILSAGATHPLHLIVKGTTQTIGMHRFLPSLQRKTIKILAIIGKQRNFIVDVTVICEAQHYYDAQRN